MRVNDRPDQFTETKHCFEKPTSTFMMLFAEDGSFLSADDFGILGIGEAISDYAMWQRNGAILKHVFSDLELEMTETDGGVHLTCGPETVTAKGTTDGEAGTFVLQKGPAQLPSDHLRHLQQYGWVCLPSILAPEIVTGLQRIACSDEFEGKEPERRRQIVQDVALAKTAVEPLSLWLSRQYMKTHEIKLAHAPGVNVLTTDDGKRAVQGWHSDYPYHWGINAAGKVPTPSGETVMGVQRIVCVSEYTGEGGATAFKLGSHVHDHGPPEEWGLARDTYRPGHRAENGLPYGGPDADIIEAPAGSVIIFDTRTWHRAGINRQNKGRAALLMDTTPAYIIPYSDTGPDYQALLESEVHEQLSGVEQRELRRLMVHRFLGPAGPQSVIGTNEILSETVPRE